MTLSEVFPPKTCTVCKQSKSFMDFYIKNWITDALQSWCNSCAGKKAKLRRKNNPNQKQMDRRYNLKHHNQGMTIGRYDELLQVQNGRCAICKQPETAVRSGKVKRLAVDHSHKTNTNRGLLCSRCNVAIGYFRESAELLKAAAEYLKTYENK